MTWFNENLTNSTVYSECKVIGLFFIIFSIFSTLVWMFVEFL